MTSEEFNTRAMQILLYAGDAKNKIMQVMTRMLEDDSCEEDCQHIMEEASADLLKAHKEQTNVIQATITEEGNIPLLFIHAQDTLMTVKSEYQMMQHILKLYYRKIKN